MQLHILDTTDHSVRAGYECPCGCRPTVTYQRTAAPVHEGCCCGNQFVVGPEGTSRSGEKKGYRPEAMSLAAPWGEALSAEWLIGPSVHADAEGDHDHGEAASGAHRHDNGSHDERAAPGAPVIDPVCGMTVDPGTAGAKDLRSTYGDRDYYFCGRGCKLDFDEDPERYLDPSYAPSM